MRLAVLWLATTTWSCMDLDEQYSSAEAKFVTLVQSLGEQGKPFSLLHKVHNESLTIRYGFAPGCNSKYSDAQVERDITKVMRLWLEPLRDWSERPASDPIVDTFTYLKGTAGEETGERNHRELSGPEGSELDITFYCQRGRTFIFFGRTPPQIHIYEEAANSYSLSTLTHEVGHAFGLNDTYVEYDNTNSGRRFEAEGQLRHNRSDCGSEQMIGCQPLSIMNIDAWLVEDNNNPHLGEDDVAGLRWLYRYLITGDASCPSGFISELSTGGCIPADPLAFAMKQGDIANVIELLAERGLPIDAQDDKGNTVLHYAAQRAASHGGYFYRQGIKAGGSPDIKNKQGETARDILLPSINSAMRSGKLHIAADLISLAIID